MDQYHLPSTPSGQRGRQESHSAPSLIAQDEYKSFPLPYSDNSPLKTSPEAPRLPSTPSQHLFPIDIPPVRGPGQQKYLLKATNNFREGPYSPSPTSISSPHNAPAWSPTLPLSTFGSDGVDMEGRLPPEGLQLHSISAHSAGGEGLDDLSDTVHPIPQAHEDAGDELWLKYETGSHDPSSPSSVTPTRGSFWPIPGPPTTVSQQIPSLPSSDYHKELVLETSYDGDSVPPLQRQAAVAGDYAPGLETGPFSAPVPESDKTPGVKRTLDGTAKDAASPNAAALQPQLLSPEYYRDRYNDGSVGWLYHNSVSKQKPDEALDLFLNHWGLRNINSASGHTKSTSSRSDSQFDTHLHSDLQLRHVKLAPAILGELSSMTDRAVKDYKSKRSLPPLTNDFPTPHLAHEKYKQRAPVRLERDLQKNFEAEVSDPCSLVASTLHFHLPSWMPVFQWNLPKASSAIADGVLTFRDVNSHPLKKAIPARMRDDITIVQDWLLQNIAHWEFKSLVVGGARLMQAIVAHSGQNSFEWHTCITGERCKSPNHLVYSKDGPMLKLTGHRTGLNAKVHHWAFPFPPVSSHPEHTLDRVQLSDVDDLEDKARDIIQQAWAQAVKNDTTWFAIDAGMYVIFAMRSREDQTMYISDVVKVTEFKAYAKLQIGFYIGAYTDAVRRAELLLSLLEEKRLPAWYNLPYSGEDGDSSSRPSFLQRKDLARLCVDYVPKVRNQSPQGHKASTDEKNSYLLKRLLQDSRISVRCVDDAMSRHLASVELQSSSLSIEAHRWVWLDESSPSSLEAAPVDHTVPGKLIELVIEGKQVPGGSIFTRVAHIAEPNYHKGTFNLVVKISSRIPQTSNDGSTQSSAIINESDLSREYAAYSLLGAEKDDPETATVYGLFRTQSCHILIMKDLGKSLTQKSLDARREKRPRAFRLSQELQSKFMDILNRAHSAGVLYGAPRLRYPTEENLMIDDKGNPHIINWKNSCLLSDLVQDLEEQEGKRFRDSHDNINHSKWKVGSDEERARNKAFMNNERHNLSRTLQTFLQVVGI